MSPPGEFELIARFFKRDSSDPSVETGIGDDAAVLSMSGRMAVAVDTLVEGVHFPVDMPARALGHRALAVNFSDLAAMGVQPQWFTLALTLPAADSSWLAEFAAGMFALAEFYGASLVGGDTTRGPLSVTIQAMGDAGSEPLLYRRGGSPGDAVYVTGTLGDAAAALAICSGSEADKQTLRERFEYPQPRIAAGIALRRCATAGIDISDGLIADLEHICRASGCGARVDVDRLPLSPAMLACHELDAARAFALCGGDDYELCVAVPKQLENEIADVAQQSETIFTKIGELIDGNSLVNPVVLESNGRSYSFDGVGYEHF